MTFVDFTETGDFGPFNWGVATDSPDVTFTTSAAETPPGPTLTHPSLGITADFRNLSPIDITFTPGDVPGQPTPDATFYLDPTIVNDTGLIWSGFSLQLVGSNPGHFEEFPGDTEHPAYTHFHDAASGMFASPQIGSLSIDGSNDYGYIPNISGGIDRESKAILGSNSVSNEIYNGDTEFWQYFGVHAVTGDGDFTLELTPIVHTTPPNVFNNVDEAGILWQNSNGDTALWNPNGSGGFSFEDLGVVGGGWQIAGTGDFNGAGKAGLLWRNSNGDTLLWNANGSGGFTGQDLGVVGTNWQIAGTGDFTGKGEDSILWRNANGGEAALWNPNGSGGFTFESLGVVENNWQIAGTGDFTGNGEDSILWRNANGDTFLWNPNGSGGFTGQDLGVVGTNWQIAGTGDFTGNGEDSILWRNANGGETALWNPNGSGGFTFESLGVVGTNWQIAGTGDFTGNGEDSILWRNANGGETALWNPNGSGGFAFRTLGVVGTSWTVHQIFA